MMRFYNRNGESFNQESNVESCCQLRREVWLETLFQGPSGRDLYKACHHLPGIFPRSLEWGKCLLRMDMTTDYVLNLLTNQFATQ